MLDILSYIFNFILTVKFSMIALHLLPKDSDFTKFPTCGVMCVIFGKSIDNQHFVTEMWIRIPEKLPTFATVYPWFRNSMGQNSPNFTHLGQCEITHVWLVVFKICYHKVHKVD
jgi:hypothetical protein